MPSVDTVEAFVSMVEAGQGVKALEKFYAEHASMQENNAEPRVGKAALLTYERAAQDAVTSLRASCIRPVLIAGDIAVVRWVFEYASNSGPVRFEELAYQRWDSEQIIDEKFFYDPGQFK
jgi:hypothetical protein